MMDARTPRFLMANLGSEVSRLLRSKEQGDMNMAQRCLERAQKILVQIVSAPEMVPRKRELELLETVVNDLLKNNPKYSVGDKELTGYLLPFAKAAMNSF